VRNGRSSFSPPSRAGSVSLSPSYQKSIGSAHFQSGLGIALRDMPRFSTSGSPFGESVAFTVFPVPVLTEMVRRRNRAFESDPVRLDNSGFSGLAITKVARTVFSSVNLTERGAGCSNSLPRAIVPTIPSGVPPVVACRSTRQRGVTTRSRMSPRQAIVGTIPAACCRKSLFRPVVLRIYDPSGLCALAKNQPSTSSDQSDGQGQSSEGTTDDDAAEPPQTLGIAHLRQSIGSTAASCSTVAT
jgi:hypothetical protein